MRWLEWADIDLAGGIGGVEVHARRLAEELARLGVQVLVSRDRDDLRDPSWDVVHTHGCFLPWRSPRLAARAHLHTLHGSAIGRLAACHEWLWPGGWSAYSRELVALGRADGVLGVHPRLQLLSLARRLGKAVAVCGNGWDALEDSGESAAEAAVERLAARGPFWLYVGRSADPVKNPGLLLAALERLPGVRLLAVPGENLAGASPRVEAAGWLNTAGTQALMSRAEGLVLSSRYEGLPLVVVEALAHGARVVATPAGGLRTLPAALAGLHLSQGHRPQDLASAWGLALAALEAEPDGPQARALRAQHNRALLPRWRDVAAQSLAIARALLAGKYPGRRA